MRRRLLAHLVLPLLLALGACAPALQDPNRPDPGGATLACAIVERTVACQFKAGTLPVGSRILTVVGADLRVHPDRLRSSANPRGECSVTALGNLDCRFGDGLAGSSVTLVVGSTDPATVVASANYVRPPDRSPYRLQARARPPG